MNKIRRNDEVFVLAGRDKGKTGTVERVIGGWDGKPERLVVRGINMATHYQRPNPQKNEPGGIVKREAFIHVSNVAVIDPESKQPARVKIKIGDGGKKVRVFHTGKKGQE